MSNYEKLISSLYQLTRLQLDAGNKSFEVNHITDLTSFWKDLKQNQITNDNYILVDRVTGEIFYLGKVINTSYSRYGMLFGYPLIRFSEYLIRINDDIDSVGENTSIVTLTYDRGFRLIQGRCCNCELITFPGLNSQIIGTLCDDQKLPVKMSTENKIVCQPIESSA